MEDVHISVGRIVTWFNNANRDLGSLMLVSMVACFSIPLLHERMMSIRRIVPSKVMTNAR